MGAFSHLGAVSEQKVTFFDGRHGLHCRLLHEPRCARVALAPGEEYARLAW
jgi:hypothetical protein